jgi:D-glycero-D-manno-heptose 1,7-bisphosphate phosphatase
MGRPAIFFDRDGTLSHEIGYVNHLARFRLLPYAVDAVRLVNASGRLAVLVTNQAGVARGYFPESLIHEVHAHVRAAMEAGGARLDGIYVCVHHPSVGAAPYRRDCDCRKPKPGLLLQAEKDLGADLARSWMIGDRHGDVAVAWAAARTR